MRIIETDKLTADGVGSNTLDLWVYNGLDCCVTLEVSQVLDSYMDETARRTYNMSRLLQGPILEMNMRGVRVDLAARADAVAALEADLEKLNANFDRICLGVCGRTFNYASPKQLQELLYEYLRLPEQKSRKGNEYKVTTDRDALENLKQRYFSAKQFCAHILKARDVAKQLATLRTALGPDGRIRTGFSIAGTKTGRLASSLGDFSEGGNLQNVDRRIRKIFIPDPGWKFANIDLEQADARNVGAMCWHLFGADTLLNACESGDLHTAVARMCWSELPWTGDPRKDREIAERPFYREDSYRQTAKKLGHGCLTADHEVLTPQGWVSIDTCPEVILQWSPEGSRAGRSEFAYVSHWEAHKYSGELHLFEGNAISARMTHDHRVPFKRDPGSTLVYEQPASAGPGKFMPLGGGYVGGHERVPARLIAAHMADGSQETNRMSFHLRKGRKISRLISLCEKYGYEYRIHGDKVRVAGRLPKEPGAFMLQWDRESIEDFVDELKYWDGTVGPSAVSISSTNVRALEWYQTLARLVGIGGNISKPYTSGFGSAVYRLQQNRRAYANGNTVTHTTEPADAVMVYCPTVPSSWFYVRRNGRIFVTGNTNFNGQPATMALHTKTPKAVIEEFQRRYFRAFPEVQKRIDWVNQQLQTVGHLTTLFGRRRYFFKRRDDKKTLNEACAYDPQSMTADEINYAMLNLWGLGDRIQLLLQVHDSLLLQYREEDEAEIVPLLAQLFLTPLTIRGRTFTVPCEVKVGWNWADASASNPYGLVKWKGADMRRLGA